MTNKFHVFVLVAYVGTTLFFFTKSLLICGLSVNFILFVLRLQPLLVRYSSTFESTVLHFHRFVFLVTCTYLNVAFVEI